MKTVIDVLLLIIIALCTWNGYKRGLIGGIAGILVIVISLFGGSLLSSAYSGEFIPALEPFVNGFVDSQKTREGVLETLGYGESDKSLNDILAEDPSLRHDYAYECMQVVGFYDSRAEELAQKSVELSEEKQVDMTEAVVAVLCDTITYVGGLLLAFLMILILITAVGNLFNISLRLPNMENLDEIGGAGLGFVKGFLFCVLISWLLSFFGVVIGRETMDESVLARFFLSFEFITQGIM